MTSISFITTCKNRLQHVRETLPRLSTEQPDEIIFVDYGCPQNSGDWVAGHSPEVKVVRVTDDAGFSAARARNIGAAAATSDWICFIDADIKVEPGWVAWLRKHVRPRFHYRHAAVNGERDLETWGTVVCPREAFEALGGYDEAYNGWGGEDSDLYGRLELLGLPTMQFPANFISAISHEDALRVHYVDVKNKNLQMVINSTYREIKLSALAAQGGVLAPFGIETRRSIMAYVTDAVLGLVAAPQRQPKQLVLNLKKSTQVRGFGLATKSSLTFDITWPRVEAQ